MRADLRSHDHDRYLAALFAPADVRDDLIALYAANAALERIGCSVTEPMLGEIRLQWWRDALREARNGKLTGDPVADAFAGTALRRQLDPARISDMIDARAFDIGGEPMPDMRALRTWLGKTDGAVFHIASQIAAGASAGVDKLADEAGLAYGIVQMMRRLPADRAHGIDFTPQADIAEVERARGCDHEKATREVLERLREEATGLLGPLRSRIEQQQNPRIRLAFMPLALAPSYLSAMERSDDWLQTTPDVSSITKLWQLWRAS